MISVFIAWSSVLLPGTEHDSGATFVPTAEFFRFRIVTRRLHVLAS